LALSCCGLFFSNNSTRCLTSTIDYPFIGLQNKVYALRSHRNAAG
jgi:hypothetical protein